MKLLRSSLLALAATATLACSGKLKVGNQNQPEAGASAVGGSSAGADSDGTTGGSGSLPSAGRGGSAGASGSVNGGSGSVGSATGGSAGAGANPNGGVGGLPCPDFMFPCNVSDTPSDDEADYWESLPRVPAVKGSAAGCIEGPITPKSDCEAPGQYCDYRFDDEGTHQVEQCLCSPSATKDGGTWHCSSAGQDGVDPCPEEKPADGADCFGFYGLECEFPWRIGCTCSADTKKWACVDPPGIPDDAPRPSLSNLDKPVAELTSAERETICTWSATMSGAGEGFPPIAAAPVDAQGFTTGTACIFGDPDICRAAAPLLSKAQCLANLELSSCEAPVELMVDCALSLHYTCTPADQACGKYLRQTGCAGTMLGAGNDLSSCHLKVQ